jgi:hypothetical protein
VKIKGVEVVYSGRKDENDENDGVGKRESSGC